VTGNVTVLRRFEFSTRDFGSVVPFVAARRSQREKHVFDSARAYRPTLGTGSIFAPHVRLTIPNESDSAWAS
jgi:hypothetical protein